MRKGQVVPSLPPPSQKSIVLMALLAYPTVSQSLHLKSCLLKVRYTFLFKFPRSNQKGIQCSFKLGEGCPIEALPSGLWSGIPSTQLYLQPGR